jgi:hypothetical protein
MLALVPEHTAAFPLMAPGVGVELTVTASVRAILVQPVAVLVAVTLQVPPTAVLE